MGGKGFSQGTAPYNGSAGTWYLSCTFIAYQLLELHDDKVSFHGVTTKNSQQSYSILPYTNVGSTCVQFACVCVYVCV